MESAKKFLPFTNQLGTFSPKRQNYFLLPHITSKISHFVHMFAENFSNIFLFPLDRQRKHPKFKCFFKKSSSLISWDRFLKKLKKFLTLSLINWGIFIRNLTLFLKQNKKVAKQHLKRCRMTTFVQRDNITFSFRVADSQR